MKFQVLDFIDDIGDIGDIGDFGDIDDIDDLGDIVLYTEGADYMQGHYSHSLQIL